MEKIIAQQSKFTLLYNGKNITEDIAKYCNGITFEDSAEDESSSIDIELENEDELWSNGWYPVKGDKLELSIGDMACGTFHIDEIELSGPPHIVTIRAIDHIITKADPTAPTIRTKKSKAHEKKSLRQIAQHVASANGLTLEGSVPNIMFERVSQHRETDLKFLRRVSFDYGIIFTVRDNKLVYTSLYQNDNRDASLTKDRSQVTRYTIKDKAFAVYQKATVSYHNPKTAKVVAGGSKVVEHTNKDGFKYPQIEAADTLVIHKRVENQQQAEAVATAHLYRANSLEQSGTFEMEGDARLQAGNNIELTGFGTAGSGIWNMLKVTHTLNGAQDWTVSIDTKRIAAVDKAKQKSSAGGKPHKKVASSGSKVVNYTNKDGFNYPQIEGK